MKNRNGFGFMPPLPRDAPPQRTSLDEERG
jgi:hypothetical protein